MKYGRLLFLWLLLFPFVTKAQLSYTFNRITTEDGFGLASNIVTSLYQDPKGFIWVGTNNGLQRFDGGKFIQFGQNLSAAEQMPYNQVSDIVPTGDGMLVLGFLNLHEFGLFDPTTFLYNKIQLHFTRPVSPRADYKIYRDSDGGIYMIVSQYGLLSYNRKTNRFEDDSHFNLPGGFVVAPRGFFEDTVKKQYWFTCDQGLVVYDKRSKQTWWAGNNPHNILLLKKKELQDHPQVTYIDRQRRTWMITWPAAGNQQVHCYDRTGKFLVKDTAGILVRDGAYKELHSFFETRGGILWAYGLANLLNYDSASHGFVQNKSSFGNSNNTIFYDKVNTMIEDRDGSIWLATDKGLYMTSTLSGTYSIINYLFPETNTSINDAMQDSRGNYWFASWGQGIRVLDSNYNETDPGVYRQPAPKNWTSRFRNGIRLAWAVCENNRTGQIMIGCNGGIFELFDPATKKTTYLLPPELDSSTVRHITQDRKGIVWIGTNNGKLVKWENEKFTRVADVGSIIYKILEDNEGLLWLATHEKGIYAIEPKTGKTVQHYVAGNLASGLYSNTAQDLEQLNDSIIVSGSGALNFINKRTRQVRKLRYEEGLPSNNVLRLRRDNNGYLWIVTYEGLCRYNPANNRITVYGRRDGITLAGIANAADFLCRNGNILLAGENAVVIFEPGALSSGNRPPDISITDFKIFNEFVPVDSLLRLREVRLSPEQNSFSIYFSALSYQHRDKITYYYKLEGYDEDWRVDYLPFQNYPAVPPGRYTFKAYCENTEGVRSANVTTMTIVVRPHFWKTKWFMALIILLIALIAYALHYSRVKRLLAVERIRSRVARDLHDDMGSTLSTINILSSMAKTKMGNDAVKTAEYLGKISDNSQRMMEAMDDIVWSIKPNNDSLQKITARMREFATSVLEAKDISFDFKVQQDIFDIKLDMGARADLFLIFKEAVNNAAKYSKATRLESTITLQQKKLVLEIKDNGRGFDEASSDNGNGLSNMKKRAESLNAAIMLESAVGEGCRIVLTVPVK